ncbi:MAG: serine/threonine protein kinase [Holophagales bacterium]|nr:serine/threonine protein kinase [Holophagales bacterium]
MDEHDLVGSRFGHLRVVGFVGAGGMGSVYLGYDEKLQRRVALKAIGEAHLDPGRRARFLREARVLSQLKHPNICEIHDYLETPERDFLVLELIDGKTLGQAIREGLDGATKMRLAEQIVGVLVAAHAQGIVHRDLKPSNVMVTTSGAAKVLDFGLARTLHAELPTVDLRGLASARPPLDGLPADPEATNPASAAPPLAGESDSALRTRLGSLVGTLGYMSPEQARGDPVMPASDIYSCGLLLQELFTGTPPFEPGLDVAALLVRAERADSLPISGLNPELTALLNRMKSAEPGVRPSALDTAERLRWIRELPRRRLTRIAASCATALVALVAIGTTYQAHRIRQEANRANREAVTAQRVSGFLVDLFRISEPGESRGSKVTARELLDKASREIEGGLGEEPALQGTLLHTMASAYAELGLHAEALRLGEKALARFRAATPPDETAIGKSLALMAVIHRRLGQYEKAEPLYRQALATQEKALGPDHEDVGTTLDSFGVFQQGMAKYAEAEGLHQRALAILEKTSGPRSRDVATALTNLANVYNSLGKYDQAEGFQRRALEIQESLLGPDHPDVAFGLNNLAALYFNMDRYEQAEELFQRVLGLLEKAQGPDHPDLGTALNNLANTAQARGDYRTAEASFLRAAGIHEKADGPGHPNVSVDLSNLSTVYRDLGRYAEAEALQRRALEADRTSFGADHPNVAFDLHQLATVLRESGRPAEAEPMQRRAVAILEKAIGPEHPTFAVALMVLADICRAEGRRDEAETVYARALGISEKAIGPESAGALDLRLRLAALHQETGRSTDAAPVLLRALDACTKAATSGDATPVQGVRHATALLLLGRDAEARPIAGRVFATGYRRQPFVELCGKHRIEPPPADPNDASSRSSSRRRSGCPEEADA